MIGRLVYRLSVGIVVLYLIIPLIAVVASSFSASGLLQFPLRAVTLNWYHDIPISYLHAAYVSFVVGGLTTVMAVLVGVPAGIALSRRRNRVSGIFNGVINVPLSVPRLVTGVALLQFVELLAGYLGLSIARTMGGIILGHLTFAIPFAVRAVVAAHAEYDYSIEEAARNLGATRMKTFWAVSLPAITPGVVAGALFAFFTSLDDVPIALFMGGGDSITLPLKMFTSIEFSFGGHVMAVSAFLIALALFSMVLIDRTLGMERLFSSGK